jgi:hypothetical protein
VARKVCHQVEYQRKQDRRRRPGLLGNNYREVRYEDLLERPEEEVGRLLEFGSVSS